MREEVWSLQVRREGYPNTLDPYNPFTVHSGPYPNGSLVA